MNVYKFRLTFIRDLLGSQPADEELRRKYIKIKMMTGKSGLSGDVAQGKIEAEIENLNKDEDFKKMIEEIEEKSITVFHRNNLGKISISDVQLRGFFKDAMTFVSKDLKMFTKKDGSDIKGEAKYRDWIGDRISFVEQYYPLLGEPTLFTRPIRFEIMGKQTSALASSELLKAPQEIEVEMMTENDVTKEIVTKILDRGIFKVSANGQIHNGELLNMK